MFFMRNTFLSDEGIIKKFNENFKNPGYHQNKNHWNTVILDGTIPEHEIQRMIEESYDLVV